MNETKLLDGKNLVQKFYHFILQVIEKIEIFVGVSHPYFINFTLYHFLIEHLVIQC